jgi:ABC-type spermidine/putrescine transport system permease subunit I
VLGGGKVIMVSSRIALDIDTFLNWGSASALGVALLVLTFLLLLLASRLTKGLSLLGSGH